MIVKFTLLMFSFLGFLSCKKEHPQQQIQTFYRDTIKPDDIKTITPEEAKTHHKDKEFQYEYRTGASGHYEYNYHVHGNDQKGNQVEGEINIEGKYGAGIIINDAGDTIEIDAEWIRNGQLKATDNKGNEYEMTVN